MMKTDRSRKPFQVGVFSVVKHCYLPRAIAAHPRFDLRCVADDDKRPDWTHKRNELFAEEFGIPYLRDVQTAISTQELDAVAVSPEAERHCDLAEANASAKAKNSQNCVIRGNTTRRSSPMSKEYTPASCS